MQARANLCGGGRGCLDLQLLNVDLALSNSWFYYGSDYSFGLSSVLQRKPSNFFDFSGTRHHCKMLAGSEIPCHISGPPVRTAKDEIELHYKNSAMRRFSQTYEKEWDIRFPPEFFLLLSPPFSLLPGHHPPHSTTLITSLAIFQNHLTI